MASSISSPQAIATLTAGISPGIAGLTGNQAISDQTNIAPTAGNGVGNADGIYFATFSITSTPTVIDFTNVKDIYGNSLTVAHIVALKISHTGTSGTITHGGGTTPIYTADPIALTAGDTILRTFNKAGLPVVGSSTQNLDLTASTGTIPVTVTAITRSA